MQTKLKVPTLFSAFTILSYRNPLYCYIIYLIVLFSLPFLAIVLYYEIYFRNTMPLNLTRTVAKQGVRTFAHSTWVSGKFCHSSIFNLSNHKWVTWLPHCFWLICPIIIYWFANINIKLYILNVDFILIETESVAI